MTDFKYQFIPQQFNQLGPNTPGIKRQDALPVLKEHAVSEESDSTLGYNTIYMIDSVEGSTEEKMNLSKDIIKGIMETGSWKAR